MCAIKRGWMRLGWALCGLALLILCGACASTRDTTAGTAAEPAAFSAVPTPALALRAGLATEDQRTAWGSEYLDDTGLWNNVVRIELAQQVKLMPDYPLNSPRPPFPQYTGLAYCIYRFHLPDYHDTTHVLYYFSDAPDHWDEAYIGIGNWEHGTWDWKQPDGTGTLHLGDMAPYIAAGGEELVLAVVLTGITTATLDYLVIGDNSAPVAEFTAEPATGTAPLAVHFNATQSYDYLGSIVNYEWDLDGDGTYELAGANLTETDYTYSAAGTIDSGLRVTDDYGLQGTATVPITVTAEPSGTWHPGAVDDDGIEAGWYPDLEEVQGLPAAVYHVHKNVDYPGVVRYVRANDAQGLAWGAPVVLGECGDGLMQPAMAIVDGNPAVTYGDANNDCIVYRRAADATGAAWNDPVTIATSVGSQPGLTKLEVVAGNPAVAFVDISGHLRYVRALDSAGASWPATDISVDSTSNTVLEADLLVCGGAPLIVYNNHFMRDIYVARAQDAAGTAWNTPQSVKSTGLGLFMGAAVVDGNPAIGYVDGDTLDLCYMRATDSTGSTWGAAVTVSTVVSTGRRDPCLAVIAGKPAISYYDQDNGKLLFVRATDTLGTAWDAPMVVDNPSFDTSGWYSALTTAGGYPCVAYYNFTAGALMFAALY